MPVSGGITFVIYTYFTITAANLTDCQEQTFEIMEIYFSNLSSASIVSNKLREDIDLINVTLNDGKTLYHYCGY